MKYIVERVFSIVLYVVFVCMVVTWVPLDASANTGYTGAQEDLHVYLLIGEENMCGGASYYVAETGMIPGCLLLNREDVWEPAENPMNRYSSIITELSTQCLNPGYAFATNMLYSAPSNTIGLIVNSKRDTTISQWRKGAGTQYYEEALRRVEIAITNGTFKGILWHQGESDLDNVNYLEDLTNLVNEFRTDLADANLPFVAGQVATNAVPVLLNNQIADLTNHLSYTAVVSSEGFGDGAIFGTDDTKVLGERFADAMMAIQGLSTGPGVGTPLVHAEPPTYTGTKEDLHVYLLIGQSNMAGRAPYTVAEGGLLDRCWLLNRNDSWEPAKNPLNRYASIVDRMDSVRLNPGYTFRGPILSNSPAASIGFVSNARGSTSILQWVPGSPYYNEAVRRMNAARATGTLKGVIWHQGESDFTDPQYIEKLELLVKGLRRDLGMPNLPFIAGEINNIPLINNQIAQLPERLSFTAYASSAGLTFLDSWHFDRDSMIVMGQRYGDLMVQIVDKDAPPLIVAQPQDRTETLGQGAIFKVIVTGTEPFYYQWRRNGVDINGATSTVYTTPSVTLGDEGVQFSVVVSNMVTNVVSADATLLTSAYPQPSIDTLLAHWKMDATAGVFANDDSGNSHDLWFQGGSRVDWTTGQVDGAMVSLTAFNAGDLSDFVDVGEEHTMAGWFTVPRYDTFYNDFFVSTNGDSFLSVMRSTSELGLRKNNSFNGCGYYMSGLSTGWHHVAAVATGTVTEFYVDGVSVGTSSVKVTTPLAYVGNATGGSAFSPTLDDVRVYGRALSVEEIAVLAAMGTEPAPVGHTITASAGSGGSITPDGDVIVVDGGSQSFVIAKNAGYEILDVLVDGGTVGAVSNYLFTNVTTNYTIAASFSLIPDVEDPTVPQNLSATAVSGVEIDLTWSSSTDNIGVAGYEIRRGGLVIDSVLGTNYSDSGLSPKTAYSYTVEAFDAQDNRSGESASANATTPEMQDLIAHWMLDETTGTVASDATGNGHDGVLGGLPTWTTNGYINGALKCNGKNDRVYINPGIAIGSEHTVAGWFAIPLMVNNFLYMVNDSGANSFICAAYYELGVRTDADNFEGCGFYLNTLSNGWHHVAAVGAGVETKLYIDGVYVGTSQTKVVSTVLQYIGNDSAGNAFSTAIDDVRLYSRALGAAEIAVLAGGAVETDTDGDGMPDEWENNNGTNPLVDDAGADSDGDGLTNLEEYICGTDPSDGNSKLETGDLTLGGSGVGVTFDTVIGRLYGVEYKDDLLAATWQLLTNNVSGTGGTVNVNDPELIGRRFYRIRVTFVE